MRASLPSSRYRAAEYGKFCRLCSDSRRLEIQDSRPLFSDLFFELRARFGYFGKAIAQSKWPAGVDQRAGARVASILVEARAHHRIEKIRARVVDERDGADRIAARANRPHDVFEVHDVNVVVNNDHVACWVRRLEKL